MGYEILYQFHIRPAENNYIDHHIERPYEHHVEFRSEKDLNCFMKERENFLHLKDQSVKATFLIKGTAF